MKLVLLESFHENLLDRIEKHNYLIQGLLNCSSYTDTQNSPEQLRRVIRYYRDVRDKAIRLHQTLREKLGQAGCRCAPHVAGLQLEIRQPDDRNTLRNDDGLNGALMNTLIFRTFVSMAVLTDSAGYRWHGMDVQPVELGNTEVDSGTVLGTIESTVAETCVQGRNQSTSRKR